MISTPTGTILPVHCIFSREDVDKRMGVLTIRWSACRLGGGPGSAHILFNAAVLLCRIPGVMEICLR